MILSLFRYLFLLVFFSFIYKLVKLVNQDLKKQSLTVATEGEKLFYPPQQQEYTSQARLENLEEEKDFNLIIPITTLGRAEHNHLIITDTYSSYEHARIIYQQDKFYLEDLQSTNGTFLNGVRLKESVELQEGDQIKIGQTVFVFRR